MVAPDDIQVTEEDANKAIGRIIYLEWKDLAPHSKLPLISEMIGKKCWMQGYSEQECRNIIRICNLTGFAVDDASFWKAYGSYDSPKPQSVFL